MGKTVVIYKSKYGTTKSYAQWIAQALGADLFDASKIGLKKLRGYDTIVLGGGLYAGGILGAKLITGNFQALEDKNLVVFTVGLADPQKPEQFQTGIDKNFTAPMKEKIKIFHLRGGMDYKNLGPLHRAGMALMKNMIQKTKEEERDEDSRQLLETYGKVVDFRDKDTISPLVAYVRSLP
jgi:flavodoxin